MHRPLYIILGSLLMAIESGAQTTGINSGATQETDKGKSSIHKSDTTQFPILRILSALHAMDLYRNQVIEKFQAQNLMIPPLDYLEHPGFAIELPLAAERRTLLFDQGISPYLSIEQGRTFDDIAPQIHVLNSKLTRWGAGIQYKVRENISFDVSVRYEVTEYFSGYIYMMGITITF
jgi:hypothetical protein